MKKIKVLQYKWGKYSNYLGLMPFEQVRHLVNIDKDPSMNREVDGKRVKKIIKYIEEKSDNLFFPPVILNSENGIRFDSKKMEISLDPQNKLKVIDGQHRLTAIKDISNNEEYKDLNEKVQKKVIPFVLIESLEPEEHRVLFNEINQNAEKVGSVVSERFEPNTKNLICLRYIAEHPSSKQWVEWEKEQSDEKIVYLHLVKCIELFQKSFPRFFKKQQREAIFDEPYHRNEDYFGIHKCFLDAIFSHIEQFRNDRHKQKFWVKRVVLVAVTESLITTIKALNLKSMDLEPEEIVNKLKETISTELQNLLHSSMYYYYTGSSSQTKSTYEAIQKYIEINRKLEICEVPEPDLDQSKSLIERYIELAEEDLEIGFEEDGNLETLATFIRGLDTNKEQISKLSSTEISNFKLTQVQKLGTTIEEEEE
ncbi:DGQHR domain-containing protein [Priestia aryabhattai]|uniref:DGQHR domain-containing protein n=1 Tax=Priestia aryabhattai TaxID=412384 RepID=UPI0018773245|nr:DGQHR domain-containing protein [Priestia aryabhattai]MBE5103329.1 DGQHR domain-containing protein [Priestia aryabhattai]